MSLGVGNILIAKAYTGIDVKPKDIVSFAGHDLQIGDVAAAQARRITQARVAAETLHQWAFYERNRSAASGWRLDLSRIITIVKE